MDTLCAACLGCPIRQRVRVAKGVRAGNGRADGQPLCDGDGAYAHGANRAVGACALYSGGGTAGVFERVSAVRAELSSDPTPRRSLYALHTGGLPAGAGRAGCACALAAVGRESSALAHANGRLLGGGIATIAGRAVRGAGDSRLVGRCAGSRAQCVSLLSGSRE